MFADEQQNDIKNNTQMAPYILKYMQSQESRILKINKKEKL